MERIGDPVKFVCSVMRAEWVQPAESGVRVLSAEFCAECRVLSVDRGPWTVDCETV